MNGVQGSGLLEKSGRCVCMGDAGRFLGVRGRLPRTCRPCNPAYCFETIFSWALNRSRLISSCVGV